MGLRDILGAAMVRREPISVMMAGVVAHVFVEHLAGDTVTLRSVKTPLSRYYVDPQHLVVIIEDQG